jgi:SET domain-containing protein
MNTGVIQHPLVRSRASSIDGTGLFASRRIPSRRRIIEYVGRKITKNESIQLCAENNPYLFALDDEHDLDGNVEWNLARFINHSCAPNCGAELIEGRIWIIAERVILPGEELTYDYGYDLEDYRDYPCLCGAPTCRGYIVSSEYAADVARREALRAELSQ